MILPGGHESSGPPSSGEPLPEFLSRLLRRTGRGPDLTRPIMGRLGFMQASPRVVRRCRVRRRVNRALFTLAMVVVMVTAFNVHQGSPQARRPVGPTLPAAIDSGIDHHQSGLSSVIRTIRKLTPSVEQNPEPADLPAEVPPQPAGEIDEDVDRSAIAPVRWV